MSFTIGTVSFNLDGTVFFLLCLILGASLLVARWLRAPWRHAQGIIKEAESGKFSPIPGPGKTCEEEPEQDTEDIPTCIPDGATERAN